MTSIDSEIHHEPVMHALLRKIQIFRVIFPVSNLVINNKGRRMATLASFAYSYACSTTRLCLYERKEKQKDLWVDPKGWILFSAKVVAHPLHKILWADAFPRRSM